MTVLLLVQIALAIHLACTPQADRKEPDLAAAWAAKASKHLTPSEADLLRRAQATILGNLVEGKAWAPYLGVMPSLGSYRGVWNWDSAFHAAALSLWDPKLARDQFRILFDKQSPVRRAPGCHL